MESREMLGATDSNLFQNAGSEFNLADSLYREHRDVAPSGSTSWVIKGEIFNQWSGSWNKAGRPCVSSVLQLDCAYSSPGDSDSGSLPLISSSPSLTANGNHLFACCHLLKLSSESLDDPNVLRA